MTEPTEAVQPRTVVEGEQDALLDIRDLNVEIDVRGQTLHVLRGVTLQVGRGEAVGIVGESGSGKTLTCMAAVGMLPQTARVTSGEIIFKGSDVNTLSEKRIRYIRG